MKWFGGPGLEAIKHPGLSNYLLQKAKRPPALGPHLSLASEGGPRLRGLSKWVISRVISRVTPFRVLITLLITHLLSPLGLQAGSRGIAGQVAGSLGVFLKFKVQGIGCFVDHSYQKPEFLT